MSSSQPVRDDYADIIDVSELLANDAFDDPSVSIGALDDSPEAQEHGLFLDRLEEFMLTQEDSVKAFALREGKPLEFIRRHVALAYSKVLFDKPLIEDSATATEGAASAPTPAIRSVVAKLCSTLDTLQTLCHVESLLLVTSPEDSDKSFIGGSKLGKSFWDAMKMGGKSGVQLFKIHCRQAYASTPISEKPQTSGGKKCKNSLKSELNTAMRVALRQASGNTSAEMRWTRPEQIENWGVRISGWPQDVPFRNPSNNKVQVNSRLLELLRSGKLKFIKPGDSEWDSSAVTPAIPQQEEEDQLTSTGNKKTSSKPKMIRVMPQKPVQQQQTVQLVDSIPLSHPVVPGSFVLVPHSLDTNELIRAGMYTLPQNMNSAMLAVPLGVAMNGGVQTGSTAPPPPQQTVSTSQIPVSQNSQTWALGIPIPSSSPLNTQAVQQDLTAAGIQSQPQQHPSMDVLSAAAMAVSTGSMPQTNAASGTLLKRKREDEDPQLIRRPSPPARPQTPVLGAPPDRPAGSAAIS